MSHWKNKCGAAGPSTSPNYVSCPACLRLLIVDTAQHLVKAWERDDDPEKAEQAAGLEADLSMHVRHLAKRGARAPLRTGGL